jgi:ribosomal subunit interface protein
MKLTVQGKHMEIGDALREHVHDHLTDAAEKYFPNPIEATVLFSKEANHRIKADITVHLGKDIILKAHYEADAPYVAFDTATERLAKRMRRYKSRMKDHQRKIQGIPAEQEMPAVYKTLESLFDQDNHSEEDAGEPTVVAEMVTSIQEMSVSEAVMRLELADSNALMFRNSDHGDINMVYRRKDGNIGWINPKWSDQKKTG